MTGKHLHRYLNEFTGRAGIRTGATMGQMERMVRRMVGNPTTYKTLTA